MPQRLADLTLRMSQEISSIEALGVREMAEAERERDRALLEMSPGREILSRYHKALEKAKQAQWDEVQKADEERSREVAAAEEKRRDRLAREERSYREALAEALAEKNEASRKAKEKWKQAIEKAREQPLSDQRRLRQTADDVLERSLDEARESYNRAVEESRLAHQSAVQDHMVEERLAVETARRKAERLMTAAAIEYERATAMEEARMRAELAAYPEAQRAQKEHDRRLAEIRESCEQAKEAVFQKFRRERRGGKR